MKDNHLKVIAFCDSDPNKHGQEHLGLPVLSASALFDQNYGDCNVVIATSLYRQQICDGLISKGFPENRLFTVDYEYNCTSYIYQKAYFGPEFLKPVQNEVFVDAGCYDGGTIRSFTRFCGDMGYKRVFGFEPHPGNYTKTMSNLAKWGIDRTTVVQKGAWSSDAEFEFQLEFGGGSGGAKIADTGSHQVVTTSIDKLTSREKVTFIKMDIEGAELEALKGARETIANDKPKLAICLYHKPEDVVEIPLYIQKIQPEYKFYIRYHNYANSNPNPLLDTVLYAV